ncbi:GNAT family N-acetyltransferase [Mesorhizobium sangaii]|uniref:RimJ/RimL family protein N-acetyltransferase n=1 Tax=Mesorhizobium sangaii TaxID=505389 RepID=A0A841P8G1_9HYPH|nr:GNAT family protein [Mesorhizobium sangaii]MBB6409108.1 RimJ/RimL family protein N-acetyltransferase [Mesorhizobium sangaii]
MSSDLKPDEIPPGDAPVPAAVVLVGRSGRLRPLDAGRDASRLYPLSHDEHTDATWVDMKVGPFAGEQAFADHVAELVADKKRAFFAVAGLDDKPLGWLCLMEARPSHHVVELGYVLYTPPLQRTRLATEALYLILRHVFDDLGYRRLEWTCTSTNLRSRKAADRLGFVYEGTLRQGLFLKGKPCDICVYSMLSSEWPDHRSAFEAWLDPGNFDAGRQLRSVAEIRSGLGAKGLC